MDKYVNIKYIKESINIYINVNINLRKRFKLNQYGAIIQYIIYQNIKSRD